MINLLAAKFDKFLLAANLINFFAHREITPQGQVNHNNFAANKNNHNSTINLLLISNKNQLFISVPCFN